MNDSVILLLLPVYLLDDRLTPLYLHADVWLVAVAAVSLARFTSLKARCELKYKEQIGRITEYFLKLPNL